MLIRKKALKIQERLGMRIGIAYGFSKKPFVKTASDTVEALIELYKLGFRAFVMPHTLFSSIRDIPELYKEAYGELLKIKSTAQKYNIELSMHVDVLPEDPVALDNTLKIYSSIANIMDCRNIIFHPTFYKMMPNDQALKLVIYKFNEMVNNFSIKTKIGVETTGRVTELGSVEDVIDIVRRTTGTEPVLNFAHIHARGSGALRSETDIKNIIGKVKTEIGHQWLQNAYFLFSGVTYGPSGVKDYIPFAKSDLKLMNLIKSIMSFNMKGTLIFEDPERENSLINMLKDLGDMVR